MKLRLGSKIAELRKENGVTQEQLAGVVGVSVAAVSKWESASTYPDITLLPAIASFFQVSVDALLDYQVESKNLQAYRDKLKELVKVSDYVTGLPLAEEALKKYPNDFEILLSMARFTVGGSRKSPDRIKAVKTGIEYFNRALSVLPPNPPIPKEVILQNMSYAYNSIGEYDKAISILEEINANHSYDPDIAYFLMESGRMKEAKSKLQDHLFGIAFGLGLVTGKLAECYHAENNLQYVVDLKKLQAAFLQSFTHDTPNYCDLICVWSFHDLAKSQLEIGDLDGMWESLGKSVYHAVRFDQNPSYAMASVKFIDGSDGSVSNNSTENACREIKSRLKADFPQFQNDARMIDFLQQLEAAATNKRESGIWK